MPRDWVKFPELRNNEIDELYWESPHKQITESFDAFVVKVVDGDTIRVSMDERDFDFPIRMLDINALEMNEGGNETKQWLKQRIEGKKIEVVMDRHRRVGKWGRLLGHIFHDGQDLGEEMLLRGFVTTFEAREEGQLPNLEKELNIGQWLTTF